MGTLAVGIWPLHQVYLGVLATILGSIVASNYWQQSHLPQSAFNPIYSTEPSLCVIIGIISNDFMSAVMNGKITTFFEDKGFGFITDEDGENRYFHVIKVQNPEQIKKNALVTFEPTNNTKGLSAYAIKVQAPSKYITISNEKIKISSIKSFCIFTREVPVKADVDKENTVLSVGLLMNRIRPQVADTPQVTEVLQMISILTFQNITHTFSEHETDIDAALQMLKGLGMSPRS